MSCSKSLNRSVKASTGWPNRSLFPKCQSSLACILTMCQAALRSSAAHSSFRWIFGFVSAPSPALCFWIRLLPHCQKLCPFFLNSTRKVGKLQGHSKFPCSCALLISSKPLSLSYPWTLLQSLCGFCCRRRGRRCQRAQLVLPRRPCAARSCPAWSSWTAGAGQFLRQELRWGSKDPALLKGGLSVLWLSGPGASQYLYLCLCRENGEKEREQILSVGLQLQDQAQPCSSWHCCNQWHFHVRVWWECGGLYWYMLVLWNEAVLQYIQRQAS